MDHKFHQGDIVIIHKPTNVDELPTWIPSMDDFDGMECTVKKYTNTGFVVITEIGGYKFNENWLELAIDIDLDTTDIALTDFLSEWR